MVTTCMVTILRKKGLSYEDVGNALQRAASSIWNEVSRNKTDDEYDPVKAKHKAYVKRKYAKYQGMKIVKNSLLQVFVERFLLDGQSPEDISGRLKYHPEKGLDYVSKEAVERLISLSF